MVAPSTRPGDQPVVAVGLCLAATALGYLRGRAAGAATTQASRRSRVQR